MIAPVERAAAGESAAHRQLKALARDWLRAQGCAAVAAEVRLPLSNFRADVAGYRARSGFGAFGDTFVVECKQSRADFLRDAGLEAESRVARSEAEREAAALRALLATHLPDCRQGLSLFREYDEYDFSELRHERWRRLVARLDRLERRLKDGVKLSRIGRYGCATYCWLAVEPGVLRSLDELPASWGALEREGEGLRALAAAPRLFSRPEAKLALLERIAARR